MGLRGIRFPFVPSDSRTKAAPRRIKVTINQSWSNSDDPVEASTVGVNVTGATAAGAAAAAGAGAGAGAAIPTKLSVNEEP